MLCLANLINIKSCGDNLVVVMKISILVCKFINLDLKKKYIYKFLRNGISEMKKI